MPRPPGACTQCTCQRWSPAPGLLGRETLGPARGRSRDAGLSCGRPSVSGRQCQAVGGLPRPILSVCPVCHGPQAGASGPQAQVYSFSAQEPGPSPRGSQPASSCSGSQGRDLQLCVWDLAEGRNAVVDAVRLESMGFCRASVLAEGPQRWLVAVPGRGNDEVSEPRAALGSLSG